MNESQEIHLAGESSRGAKAKAVLESELFQESISLIEQDTLEKWKNAPVRDSEGQLILRLKWQVLHEIKAHLKDVMMTGKMAETTLSEQRTLAQRAKDAVKAFRR